MIWNSKFYSKFVRPKRNNLCVMYIVYESIDLLFFFNTTLVIEKDQL